MAGNRDSGRAPLGLATVRAIERSLQETKSIGRTARMHGVSRNTVYRIAKGKHPQQTQRLPRCGGCGSVPTSLPCRTCQSLATV